MSLHKISLNLLLHTGQTANPAETLRQVTEIVDRIEDPAIQANLIAASAILALVKIRARRNLCVRNVGAT